MLAHSAAALHSSPRLRRRADGAFIVAAHAHPRVRARKNTKLAVFLRRSRVVFITPLRLCFHAASPKHLSSLCEALGCASGSRKWRWGWRAGKNNKSQARLTVQLSSWCLTKKIAFVKLK